MKLRLSITLIAVFLMAACTSQTDYHKLLVQADSAMQSQPDNALKILENIHPNKLQTKADSAYYALLLTQARDKNFVVQTDDSLILSAIAYYDQTSNIDLKARSYYYCGCVYRDLKDIPKTISHFLTAKELAESTKNLRLLSLIYQNLGYLYYAQDLNEQADSLYQKAWEMGVLLKDTLLQTESLSQQGMIQMERGEHFYPEAEKRILQALRIAEALDNKFLKERIYLSLSILYSRIGSGKKALEFAKRNLALQEDTTDCYDTYQLLGNAYYKHQQYDSATFYLHKALPAKNYATKAGVYRRLADIAKAIGNPEESSELEQKYSIYMDSMRNARSQHARSVIRAEKDAQIVHQQKEYDLVIHRNKYFLLSLITVAMLFALFILRKNRKKTALLQEEKKRVEDIQAAMRQQNAKFEKEQLQKEERIAYLENELKQLHYDAEQKKELSNELETLNNEQEAFLRNTKKYSDVEDKMNRIIRDFKDHEKSELHMEKEDWLQLIAETDRRWNKITLKLSKYGLDKDEIYLCCLFLTGLPVSHMGYLLDCTRDTIYKRANRIVKERMGYPPKTTSLQKVLKGLR